VGSGRRPFFGRLQRGRRLPPSNKEEEKKRRREEEKKRKRERQTESRAKDFRPRKFSGKSTYSSNS
jgi:hypothetical protein